MKIYNHVFFDLDRTLWDFNKNSTETLEEIWNNFHLSKRLKTKLNFFLETYFEINEEMWRRYRIHEISKEDMRISRFEQLLEKFNAPDSIMANDISTYYLSECPLKLNLVEATVDVLSHLSNNYELHIITNGFSESQYIKLDQCRLRNHFKHIVISEEVGFKKPEVEIFMKAMELAGSNTDNSIMIGDDLEVDIIGAHNAGMDQIHYNPNGFLNYFRPTFEVKKLSEVMDILT